MRLGIGALACALLLAGAAQAGEKASIEFGRVVVTLQPGDDFGQAGFGDSCSDRHTLTWKEGEVTLAGTTYAAAFDREAAQAGFGQSGANLFETKEEADFIVSGRLKYLKVRFCERSEEDDGKVRRNGDASLDIEWQVYSRADRKVVATVTASGDFAVSTGDRELLNTAVLGAFADSAHTLLRKQAFLAAVTSETTTTVAKTEAGPKTPLTQILLPGSLSAARRSPARSVGSTVAIFTASALGSGFLVSTDGYVLTNAHVVGRQKIVKLRWPDGRETSGEVIRKDEAVDVALIKTDPGRIKPLPLRPVLPAQGETVYAIGTPLSADLQGTLTRGIVSATRMDEGHLLIQSDTSITHGNSGGPMLDERGLVVAITQSTIEGSSAQLNFFIPISEALKALALKPGP